MARTKKTDTTETEVLEATPKSELPPKLAIDFATEGLNNIARTVNALIDHLR